MSNWLQNATKTCCDELYEIAMFLQAKEEAFIKANDNYYGVALATLDATDIHQEQSAIAFVAAVNSDINRSKYKIDGLGHVCSAAKILRTAITDFSRACDEKLMAIANDHTAKVSQNTFNKWRDQLVQNALKLIGTHQQLLDSILRTSDSSISSVWSSALKLVGAMDAFEISQDDYIIATGTYDVDGPQYEDMQSQSEDQRASAFYHLADKIKSLLQEWAKKINREYSIFRQTLSNFKYLSARDLFSWVNKTCGTDKPITITPYTTTAGMKGLLVTIGGTDPFHWWDDSVITALMTGEDLPNNPYMLDVKDAIVLYMSEYPHMEGAEITFAGYSLGGMVAQKLAEIVASKRQTALTRYRLHVTNVITYGSPVMGPPVNNEVRYAMYDAICDPIPLLSVYENPHLHGVIQALTAELGKNPLNVIFHFNKFLHASSELWGAYRSIVEADCESWEQKMEEYIDPRHDYKGKIYRINDVGNDSVTEPLIGHVLNLNNHFKYSSSDQLNVLKTVQALPNIDPQSWGPTEYFGM